MAKNALYTKIIDVLENITDAVVDVGTITAENIKNNFEIELLDVTDARVVSGNGKVSLTWTDPDNVVSNNATLAKWVGTTVVRKEGSAPTGRTDGTVIVDSTTRNAYASTPFVDTGLTNGTIYYYRFFPHTSNVYTAGTSVSTIPNEQKATISVSEDTVALDFSHLRKTIVIGSNSDGEISVTCSDVTGAICIANLSGNIIIIDGVNDGNATITINQIDGTKYSAPDPVTINVSVELFHPILDENEPFAIQEVVTAGKAATLWSVGDNIGIVLNGTVGKQIFNNQKFYASILGFDHNKAMETDNKYSVHFIFGKNITGTNITFCDFDGAVGQQGSDVAFRMNLSKTNIGGWEQSYMRNTICSQFLAAMPSKWQSFVGTVTKYSDNTGGNKDDYSDTTRVTATQEKIFLLSEFEVFGVRTYANIFEQNSQQQYAYYINGNSKIRYNHRDGRIAAWWWLRSARTYYTWDFCHVNSDGVAFANLPQLQIGFTPCFVLIG